MTVIARYPVAESGLPAGWHLKEARPADTPDILAFLTAAPRLTGKKFGATLPDIDALIASAWPGEAKILRGLGGAGAGGIEALSVLHSPHGEQPEILSTLLTRPDLPLPLADHLLLDQIRAFDRIGRSLGPGAFLRFIQGDRQEAVVRALLHRGARIETRFYRLRRSLAYDDETALDRAAVPGFRLLPWADVLACGLSEAVRQLQYDTFREHFGNMSKTREDWPGFIGNPGFARDYSFALTREGNSEVVGYALASFYSDDSGPGFETLPHIDYIGVAKEFRGQGLAKLILQKFWLEALRRGHRAVSLGSDIFNRTGSVWLYLGQGYAPVEHQASYRFDLGDEALLRATGARG